MASISDWQVFPLLTQLHWAHAIAGGHKLPATIRNVDELYASVSAIDDVLGDNTDRDQNWRYLIGVAGLGAKDARSILQSIARHGGSSPLVGVAPETLLRLLNDYLTLADAACKTAVSQLSLRVRPLRTQWEACGPGLLNRISAISGGADSQWPAILPVAPIRGGAGDEHFPMPTIRIEAVLANPMDELPESLRIAWLMATWMRCQQTNAGSLNRDVRVRAGTASVSVVLQAAEELGIASFNRVTCELATNHWVQSR